MLGPLVALLPLAALASCASVRTAFDVAAHLGNLSPYAAAPVPHGLDAALPADCTVDQVLLVRRPPLARTRSADPAVP